MNTLAFQYKPLLIDFEIPDDLKDMINQYLQYLNKGDRTSDDYYKTEIKLILNWCLRESLLTENQIALLRNYYQNDGILGA